MYTLDQHHKLPNQSDPKCLALDSYFFRILLVQHQGRDDVQGFLVIDSAEIPSLTD
jgi:hypothetical protein